MADKEDLKKLSKEALLSFIEEQQCRLNFKERESASQKAMLDSQKATLDSQKATLDSQKATLDSQKATLDSQKATLDSQKEKLGSQKAEILSIRKNIEEKEERIALLEILVAWLNRTLFGSSSEKRSDEEDEPDSPEDEEADEEDEEVEVKGHKRKKGTGRSKLPKELRRFRQEYDLPDSEKVCGCGCELKHIGDKISEQLEIIPAVLFVIEHVRKQYACPSCEENMKLSEMPKPMIPKSIAGPGLLAHIAVSKFCDHLPLYRQESILRRFGVAMTRATFANWMIRCGEAVAPLVELMRQKRLSGEIGYADETTVQVLKEPGRKAKNKSYIWLFGGGPPDEFCWVYQYHPGRGGEIPVDFWGDYSGYLHADAYRGYDSLDDSKITRVGCWAHARRKFYNVAHKKRKGVAYEALKRIGRLYEIEAENKKAGLAPEAIYLVRQSKAKPLVLSLKVWLEKKRSEVSEGSALGKAIQYSLNQWSHLERYLEDGRLEIDNNRTERAIKPFVMGRKNWLFSNSVQGTHASANLYSLIETCKAHQVEPYGYLRYLFTVLPRTPKDKLETLLPFYVAPEDLKAPWKVEGEIIKLENTESDTNKK